MFDRIATDLHSVIADILYLAAAIVPLAFGLPLMYKALAMVIDWDDLVHPSRANTTLRESAHYVGREIARASYFQWHKNIPGTAATRKAQRRQERLMRALE